MIEDPKVLDLSREALKMIISSIELLFKEILTLVWFIFHIQLALESGGFNARGSTLQSVGPYNSEEVETIELGLRTSYLIIG